MNDDDDELPPACRSPDESGISFGGGKSTPFGIELHIGTGEITLNCVETVHNRSGPVIKIDLTGFELIFTAKFQSGIADYLYIAAQTLTIKHRVDNCHEFTQWLYPKSTQRKLSGRSISSDDTPMLALSVKIENEELSRDLAQFTVAVSVSNTTIRFRFVQPGQVRVVLFSYFWVSYFLMKVLIFIHYFSFWPTFFFLANISIFDQNFHFSPNFDFLSECLLFWIFGQAFDILRNFPFLVPYRYARREKS